MRALWVRVPHRWAACDCKGEAMRCLPPLGTKRRPAEVLSRIQEEEAGRTNPGQGKANNSALQLVQGRNPSRHNASEKVLLHKVFLRCSECRIAAVGSGVDQRGCKEKAEQFVGVTLALCSGRGAEKLCQLPVEAEKIYCRCYIACARLQGVRSPLPWQGELALL